MPTARAKISSKSRIVLPKQVLERIGAGPGDTLVFHCDRRGVRIAKAPRADPFAAFDEWSGAEDDEAYRDL